MAHQHSSTARVWLNAKDNWLGEGMFRADGSELRMPREDSAELRRHLQARAYESGGGDERSVYPNFDAVHG